MRKSHGSILIEAVMFERFKKKTESFEVTLPTQHGDGKIDPYSKTWVFLLQWMEARLQSNREKNDFLKNDEIKTAALRGQIKLLKEMLALPDQKEKGK